MQRSAHKQVFRPEEEVLPNNLLLAKNLRQQVQQSWVQRYPMSLGGHSGQSVTIDRVSCPDGMKCEDKNEKTRRNQWLKEPYMSK